VGSRGREHSLIAAGLTAGERVVSSGNFFVDAESRLRASLARAPAPMEASAGAAGASDRGPSCERDFDAATAAQKYAECRRCEQAHRGMGTMEADCKAAIAKPWKAP
jgi:membrane fusion protein, copper/silver efflux system